MKSTKFIKRAVSSFLAAAMLMTLASCNPVGTTGEGTANQSRQIVNYFTSEMFEKPAELGYIANVFSVGEKIYLFGDQSIDSAEVVSGTLDLSSKEFSDIDLSSIDCEYISRSMYLGDKLFINYMDKENYESHYALVDAAGGNIIVEKKAIANSYPMSVSLSSSGDLKIVEENWGMTGSSVTIKQYDINTLEEKSLVKISDVLELTDEESVTEVLGEDDGSVYVSVVSYDDAFENISSKVIKLNPDNTIAYTIENISDIEGPASVLRMKNGHICIVSSKNYSDFMFNEIDGETGDITETYNVKLGEVRGMVPDCSGFDADMIYTTEDGIYKLDIASEKSEKLFEFGKDIPEKYSECYDLSLKDGKLFLYGTVFGDSRQQFYVVDEDGNLLETIPIERGENEYIYDMGITSEGTICCLTQNYEIDEEEGEKLTFKLKVIDEQGAVVSDTDLSELSGSINSYIEKFKITPDGKILVAVSEYSMSSGNQTSRVAVLDMDGSLLFNIESDDINYIDDFAVSESGTYLFYRNSSYDRVITKIDYDNKALGEKADFDIPMDFNLIDGDGSYDFCYKTSEGLYGFSIKENKSTEIINWVDSDITVDINNAVLSGNDKILCIGYDYQIGDTQLYTLKRADEATLKKIQNKKIITIAGVNLGYNETFKEHAAEFNKNNEEYRIQLNDYDKYSTYVDETYQSGAFQLNNDMTAGKVPDIIIGNGEIDMTSFAAKGILTDLNPYFENDAELSKEDFFENVLDVYAYDGKLYQLISDFTVSTLVGPKSKLGGESGWSFDEFFAAADKGKLFFDESRDRLTETLIKSNLSEFVDFQKKTCDFDNSNFTGLIELIKSEGVNWEENDESRDELYSSGKFLRRFADGECQAELTNLAGFYDILSLQQGAVSEEVTIKGFPSSEGNGSLIYPNSSLSICAKSKNKEAAWKFLKGFLTEEYQDGLNEEYTHTFPVRKSSFEKMLNKEMSGVGRGYSVETPDGNTVEMQPLDQVTADKIKSVITTANRAAVSDEKIGGIISEELEAVFADDKSAEEAAASIQNKVSTYLNEIK